MLINPNTLQTPADVDQAARQLTQVWDKYFSPAPSIDGKKRNKLRDMVSELAGYQGGYQSFLANTSSKENNPIEEHQKMWLEQVSNASNDDTNIVPAYVNENADVVIGGVTIHEAVWAMQVTDWRLEYKPDTVEHLMSVINNSDNADYRKDITQTLEQVMNSHDQYFWSNNNDYTLVFPSANPEKYNEICKTALQSHYDMTNSKQPLDVNEDVIDAFYLEHETYVDGIHISDKVFKDEMVDYRLEERLSFIDNLIQHLSEQEIGSRTYSVMMDELETVMGIKDEHFWSSIKTGEFIVASEDPKRFNEFCKEVLNANESID